MSEQESDFLSEYAEADKATETPDEPEQPAEAEEAETVEKPDEPEQGDQPESSDEPDTPEATTTPETHEEERVPLAALKAEREKRQRFEREKQALEQQIAEAQQQQQSDQPKPEIWDDPDAFVNQRVQALEQQFNGRLYGALEAAAREAHPDYDEVFAVVEEEAKSNPAIKHEVFSSPNPAMAAYKLGKRLQEFRQMQDPDTYKAKLKAEILAEIKAEQEAEAKRKKAAADAIPPDLSSSRNVKGEEPPAPEDLFDHMF